MADGLAAVAKNNIFLRPEEAMFIELVKACLTEKRYSVLEKIEYSSLWKITTFPLAWFK